MKGDDFDYNIDKNIPDHGDICPKCQTLFTGDNIEDSLDECLECGQELNNDTGAFGGDDTPRWNAPTEITKKFKNKYRGKKSPFDVKIIAI